MNKTRQKITKKEASLTSKCLENSHNIFKNIKNNCSYPFNIIKTDVSKFVNYIKNYYELRNITFNNIFIVHQIIRLLVWNYIIKVCV